MCLDQYPMVILILLSACQKQLAARQEQVGQCCQHIDLAEIPGHTSQPGLMKAELRLDHAIGRLYLD